LNLLNGETLVKVFGIGPLKLKETVFLLLNGPFITRKLVPFAEKTALLNLFATNTARLIVAIKEQNDLEIKAIGGKEVEQT
jgi:hypothetical protein